MIEITDSHLDDIFELYSDQKVTKYFDLKPLQTIEEAQKEIDFYKNRLKNNIGIRWGITFINKPELIGTIGFNKIIKNHKGRIGYDLQSKHW